MAAEGTQVIRFFAPVDSGSVNALLSAVDQGLQAGVRRFILLISSPGGSVFHGLSAYNFLKGIPAEVVTHNFGSVDSIGGVLYCAGSRRLSVPHARFLLHAVATNFQQNQTLEEQQLEERLKALRIDISNIAKVIASTISRPLEHVENAMLNRTTLSPDEAVAWGLTHEIRSDLLEPGSSMISIQRE